MHNNLVFAFSLICIIDIQKKKQKYRQNPQQILLNRFSTVRFGYDPDKIDNRYPNANFWDYVWVHQDDFMNVSTNFELNINFVRVIYIVFLFALD